VIRNAGEWQEKYICKHRRRELVNVYNNNKIKNKSKIKNTIKTNLATMIQ
jgi:hypothetical protein